MRHARQSEVQRLRAKVSPPCFQSDKTNLEDARHRPTHIFIKNLYSTLQHIAFFNKPEALPVCKKIIADKTIYILTYIGKNEGFPTAMQQ